MAPVAVEGAQCDGVYAGERLATVLVTPTDPAVAYRALK